MLAAHLAIHVRTPRRRVFEAAIDVAAVAAALAAFARLADAAPVEGEVSALVTTKRGKGEEEEEERPSF